MAISKGDTLPEANFIQMGDNGPEDVSLASLTKGTKTVIFAVPGAYTGVCTTAHMPSFVRTADQFRAKGVDHILCVSVNDPFVMQAWGAETGADKSGIQVLADPESKFTKALGMDFTAEPAGLIARSKRYALVAEDGKVTHFEVEASPGECTISAGESLLDAI